MKKYKKEVLLVLYFVILVWACYSLAIKKTMDKKNELNVLKLNTQKYEQIKNSLLMLRKREKDYDAILLENNIDVATTRKGLLEILNGIQDSVGVRLVAYEKPHTFEENNIRTKTYRFIVEGNFNDINKTIYLLEQNVLVGRVRHLNFKVEKNYKENNKYLQAEIFISYSEQTF
ncbi:hypothetical protein [Nonlabens agnitus]|uniref:General secretion pathway protein n=1 Tax=Nonlabens agnitus TaxID=870484 RepID=A0A2S9WQW7_9FLAO|nr:hypothetical protein [Nonlabens agnitus]PRP65882.1 hypothetical protein BST86_01645 [Nonlabens agnitus]